MKRWLTRLLLAAALAAVCVPVLAAEDGPQEGEHEGGHGDHHGLNWFYGNLAETDDPEAKPSLLFRPKGMPAPVSALLINAGIFWFVIWRFGAGPLTAALKKRKDDIMAEIDAAQQMKREAQESLASYERKLERIDREIKRVRKEMQDAARAERERTLAEARERRTRMEREARLLIDQELEAAREQLHIETVRSAVQSAEQLLSSKLTSQDQQRLADEYLGELERAVVVNARGGQA